MVAVLADGPFNSNSQHPSISADGRYVAFQSRADNLVPSDTNDWDDIFVLDRETQEIERVSVASDGSEGRFWSREPSISADGRYVAFHSKSWNFVPGLIRGDLQTPEQVYVHDRVDKTTELVSVPHDGSLIADAPALRADISGNGRFVAFHTWARNLVPGDTNVQEDVFVRDLEAGTTERVSVRSDGSESAGPAFEGSLSFDGRYVAFVSGMENEDPRFSFQAFVRDREADTVEMVSVTDDGERGNRGSRRPSLSDDGRLVAFESASTNLVPNDNNQNFNFTSFPNFDVFVHDRDTKIGRAHV